MRDFVTTLLWVFTVAFVLALALAIVANAQPRNLEVCAIQGRLTAIGYYKRNLTCKYGPYTQDAITFYQADQGMVPTGHVGPRTFKALFGCSRSDKPCMLKQTKACSQELTDKCHGERK